MGNLVSNELIKMTEEFEGFRSEPYYDCVGIKTLGYGFTGKEIEGLDYISQPDAEILLIKLYNIKYCPPILNDLKSKGVSLTQNEFDAISDMAYNVGVGGVLGSKLYKNICSGIRDKNTITSNFLAWSYGGGVQLPGLVKRRQAEAEMFFSNGNTCNNDVLIENVKDPTRIQQIKALQYNLNLDYNAKLTNADGNIYQSTLDALNSVGKLIVKGHKSHVVLWLQQKLVKWGYLKENSYTPMTYDEPTFQAVTNLQKNWNRSTSGILDLDTWKIFLNN